jgi:hypothetical protein
MRTRIGGRCSVSISDEPSLLHSDTAAPLAEHSGRKNSTVTSWSDWNHSCRTVGANDTPSSDCTSCALCARIRNCQRSPLAASNRRCMERTDRCGTTARS